jgi:hypothetical protein
MEIWLAKVTTSYQNKQNSVAFSPQANYTDWATATCWQNLVPTFVDVTNQKVAGSRPDEVNDFYQVT